MKRRGIIKIISASLAVLFCYQPVFVLGAESTTTRAGTTVQTDTVKQQVDALNQQVNQKRSRVKELDNLINSYKNRITDQETKQTSLENEVLILDNRVLKKELDIERAKVELEALKLEIDSLEKQIAEQNKRIERQKEYAAEILRQMRESDEVMPLEVLLTKRSLSAFFDHVEAIKQLEGDLTDSMIKVKETKTNLENIKKERDEKIMAVEVEKKTLKKEQLALEAERNFKASLASETKNKQSEFERVLYELREQQQTTADDISSIETRLKDKLDSIDEALSRGDVLLSWPVDPSRGITAKFHDKDYPFRHLFEHPGTDVRASVGTAIKAAAGGYVAWNKTGKMYGNYLMIIHPGGIATVYAHLSKFIAKPDTYVERGDVIGLSGGRPGDQGAGLSTGPHLHFEVRLNGIPVNAENYLPSISEDE
ncbi:MAG: peptidoglycan DD-metalloendopeptidase family protein [Patescibacteria group bacterium]